VPIDFRLDGVRQVYGTARTKAARKEDSKVFTPFSVAPAALRCSPQSPRLIARGRGYRARTNRERNM
jgi:hypothetical protein